MNLVAWSTGRLNRRGGKRMGGVTPLYIRSILVSKKTSFATPVCLILIVPAEITTQPHKVLKQGWGCIACVHLYRPSLGSTACRASGNLFTIVQTSVLLFGDKSSGVSQHSWRFAWWARNNELRVFCTCVFLPCWALSLCVRTVPHFVSFRIEWDTQGLGEKKGNEMRAKDPANLARSHRAC